jgi:hypothetical protein
MSILKFFLRSSVRRNPADLPASDRFYCYYRPPELWRSPTGPWSAAWCGTSQHSIQFLVPVCVERGGRQLLCQAGLSIFLSVVMLPHRSGQIYETAVLYYIYTAKYWERWVYTLWKRGQNWTDPRSWRPSRTMVELRGMLFSQLSSLLSTAVWTR